MSSIAGLFARQRSKTMLSSFSMLERAALLTDGTTIERAHIERALSADARLGLASAALTLARPSVAKSEGTDLSLRGMERIALRAQFEAHRGSRAELVRKLGISERSLYRRLKALGEEPHAR